MFSLDLGCFPGLGMFPSIWNVTLDLICFPGFDMFPWIWDVSLDLGCFPGFCNVFPRLIVF